MSNRIVVRSDMDNHVLFSVFKVYYPDAVIGQQERHNHRHTDLELSCVLTGAGTYRCADRDYRFTEGDVFLHCSGETHYFSSIDSTETVSMLVIRFAPRFIWTPCEEWSSSRYIRLFSPAECPGRCIRHSYPAAKIIAGLLHEIFNECQHHEAAYELIIKAKLMTILANMVRHFSSALEQEPESPASRQHLARMEMSMNYIHSHLDEPITLDSLARQACMSRSYYSSIFKALNGISVWDYIITQRIDLAQYKLETTSSSITSISGECGFTSIANFNRAFKKVSGRTPREYRAYISQGRDSGTAAKNAGWEV